MKVLIDGNEYRPGLFLILFFSKNEIKAGSLCDCFEFLMNPPEGKPPLEFYHIRFEFNPVPSRETLINVLKNGEIHASLGDEVFFEGKMDQLFTMQCKLQGAPFDRPLSIKIKLPIPPIFTDNCNLYAFLSCRKKLTDNGGSE